MLDLVEFLVQVLDLLAHLLHILVLKLLENLKGVVVCRLLLIHLHHVLAQVW